jgi:hypothetical protein
MSKQSWFAMGLGVSSLFAACADDSNVDQATAQAAASELVSSVDKSITGYQGSGGGSGAVTVKCAAGGQASVSGKVDVSTKPVSVDVKVSIDYQGCKSSNGSTMEGNIEVVQSVIAGKDPVHVKTQYSGDVVFTGKVEASCPVDITVEVDETGKAVDVKGTFCGQDAKSLDIHVSPRWQG